MGLLKVGKGIPELTPVEIDTSVTDLPIVMGQLMGWNRDRVWSVKQEPPVACDGEDVRCSAFGMKEMPPLKRQNSQSFYSFDCYG